MPNEFLEPFKAVLEYLVPLLDQNLKHKMITKQIIFFVQSNIVTIGPQILPLLSDICLKCCKNLSFDDLEDTMTLLNKTIIEFKSESILLAR